MFHHSVNSALFQDENEKAEDFLSHLWAQPAEPAADKAVSRFECHGDHGGSVDISYTIVVFYNVYHSDIYIIL